MTCADGWVIWYSYSECQPWVYLHSRSDDQKTYLALTGTWPLDADKDSLVGIPRSDLDRYGFIASANDRSRERRGRTHSGNTGEDLVDADGLNALCRTAIVRGRNGRVVGNLFTLNEQVLASERAVTARRGRRRTRKTTVTFSSSRTPASGSASTSSPGPGIARLTPRGCSPVPIAAFFLAPAGEAEGSERGGIFLDELDRMELRYVSSRFLSLASLRYLSPSPRGEVERQEK